MNDDDQQLLKVYWNMRLGHLLLEIGMDLWTTGAQAVGRYVHSIGMKLLGMTPVAIEVYTLVEMAGDGWSPWPKTFGGKEPKRVLS
jgi:hypothetical protein